MSATAIRAFGTGFAACAALAAVVAAGPRVRTCPPGEAAARHTTATTQITMTTSSEADEADCFRHGAGGCGLDWTDVGVDEVPGHVVQAASETMGEFEFRSAQVTSIGPLTLYSLHGRLREQYDVTLVMTRQGTMLQADVTTSGDDMPEELAGAVRDRFPDSTIARAGITQVVSFWATLLTSDGRECTVSFEPGEGLELVSMTEPGDGHAAAEEDESLFFFDSPD